MSSSILRLFFLAGCLKLTGQLLAGNLGPYRVLDTTQLMGDGGIDYVFADSESRRVYVPRGGSTFVFDLDTHKLVGSVVGIGGHGIAVDPVTHHGLASSNPVGMFDTVTLAKIKTVEVKGRPDGIMAEPFTGQILLISHQSPSITLVDPKDGSVTGTIDVGGALEQSQSDGQGRLYCTVEDGQKIAVVDLKAQKVVTNYFLGEMGEGPSGLGFDKKNGILFAMCRSKHCVVLRADNGKILATLPIGAGTDGGGFNPDTMEAFSSNRDGTLTIIQEISPTNFVTTQTVTTKPGGKTCTLDTKTGHIVVISVDRSAQAAGNPPPASGERRGGGPGVLNVMFIGR